MAVKGLNCRAQNSEVFLGYFAVQIITACSFNLSICWYLPSLIGIAGKFVDILHLNYPTAGTWPLPTFLPEL